MKAFNKDIVRSIRSSLGRFLAIAGIVALGAGFYAGLRTTAPDMYMFSEAYYDGTALMDLRVVSTLGLSDEDIEALRNIDGVEAVMPAREVDVVGTIVGNQYTMRIHSVPESIRDSKCEDGYTVQSSDKNYLNRLVLESGRWPQKAGECVISADKVMKTDVALGDTITLTEGSSDLDTTLNTTTYTIVGFVHTPYYVSAASMGTTSIGSGTIEQCMYVCDEDFVTDSYPISEAFITVSGARELDSTSKEYDDLVAKVTERIKTIQSDCESARTLEVLGAAQDEIDAQRSSYEEQKAAAIVQLNAAKTQLDEAAQTIAAGEEELLSGQAQYQEGVSELEQQKAAAQKKFDEAQAELDEAQSQLDAAWVVLQAAYAQLQEAWKQADMTYDEAVELLPVLRVVDEQVQEANRTIQAIYDAIPSSSWVKKYVEPIAEASGELSVLVDSYYVQLSDLVEGQATYDEQYALYQQGLAAFEQASAELASQMAYAQEQFAQAQAQLDAAAAELEAARQELEEGKITYYAGLATYQLSYSEAYAQFEEAEALIAEYQAKIDALEPATWYVMDRTKNYGVMSFESDANRVDSIAQVFPFIFFLVAALVALTTMTRMVEEERVLIGTYKALGYSRRKITSKYLIYAALASGIGSIVGIIILSKVLPYVIVNAYAIMYTIPITGLPVNIPLALLSGSLGVGVTLIATWAAVYAAMRERPASLMLPRAPIAGKRILLERIPAIWSKLSFSYKVTFRNLFLYKKRLIMTVIGIAGCTALLLTGLGLRDAINDIIDKQYGEITHRDAVVTVESDLSADSYAQIVTSLNQTEYVNDYIWVSTQSYITALPDNTDKTTSITVTSDSERFANFITLRNRETQKTCSITDDGVLVSEKLANSLGVKAGDTFTLYESDATGNRTNVSYQVKVSDVFEYYVGNNIIFSDTYYQKVFKQQASQNVIYLQVNDATSHQEELSSLIGGIDGVKTVSIEGEVIETYRTMLGSVNLIVVVLVIAAGALAFIVLYNLTNINITERIREIATLKVLGFTAKETNDYIFREVIFLSLMGAALGLILGVGLESFVVQTAEVDQVMFGRDIHLLSYVISYVLTIVFTLLISLFMRKKIASINMVESLKSIE